MITGLTCRSESRGISGSLCAAARSPGLADDKEGKRREQHARDHNDVDRECLSLISQPPRAHFPAVIDATAAEIRFVMAWPIPVPMIAPMMTTTTRMIPRYSKAVWPR